MVNNLTVEKPPVKKTVVDLGGLEPPTSRLSGVRSNLLSYRSILNGLSKLNSKVSNG